MTGCQKKCLKFVKRHPRTYSGVLLHWYDIACRYNKKDTAHIELHKWKPLYEKDEYQTDQREHGQKPELIQQSSLDKIFSGQQNRGHLRH